MSCVAIPAYRCMLTITKSHEVSASFLSLAFESFFVDEIWRTPFFTAGGVSITPLSIFLTSTFFVVYVSTPSV
jgi:hypothetical protein